MFASFVMDIWGSGDGLSQQQSDTYVSLWTERKMSIYPLHGAPIACLFLIFSLTGPWVV